MTKVELPAPQDNKPKPKKQIVHKGYARCFDHRYEASDKTTYNRIVNAIMKKPSRPLTGDLILGHCNLSSVLPITGLNAEELARTKGEVLMLGYPDSDTRQKAIYNSEFIPAVTADVDVNDYSILLLLIEIPNELPWLAMPIPELQL